MTKLRRAYTDTIIKWTDWVTAAPIPIRLLFSLPMILLIFPIYAWVCIRCTYYSYKVMKTSEETLKHFTDLTASLENAGPPPLPECPPRPRPRRVCEGSTKPMYKNADGSYERCLIPPIDQDLYR